MPFSLSSHDDWLFWSPELDAQGRAELVAARLGSEENRIAVAEAMLGATTDAQQAEAVAVVGLWLPQAREHAVLGSVQGHIFAAERPKDRNVRKFLKSVRHAPTIPGLTLTDYSVDTAEPEIGPAVIQHLSTHTGGDAPVVHTWRITIFPRDVAEIFVLEFSTVALMLLDDFENALADVVGGMTAVAA